jgi:TolA-binding protein
MLKPKKKITRKELKRDPLLETLYKVQDRLNTNRKLYTRVAIGILAVVIVVLVVNRNYVHSQEVANTLFGKALVALDLGDEEQAQFQFENLIDEYGSTEMGELAYYYLGQIYYNQKKYEQAKEALSAFIAKSSNEILLPNAHRLLSDLYYREGALESAEEHLRRAVKTSYNDQVKQFATLNLARFLNTIGKVDEATNLVESILDDDELDAEIRQGAEQLYGMIHG